MATRKPVVWNAGFEAIQTGDSIDQIYITNLTADLAAKAPLTIGTDVGTGYWREGVATFGNSAASTIGALVIKTSINAATINRMMSIRVRGYTYASSQGMWDLTFGGYAYKPAGTFSFPNSSYQLHGIPPFVGVQAALTPDGYVCFILGSDSTVWPYPKLVVDAMNGFTGATTAELEGWTVSIVADTSAYVNKSAVTRRQFAPVTIGGVSFDASANINLPGVNTTGNQNTTGSAATLTTARAINGTNFNGSAAITTANWGTARTLTVGGTGKSVNGSANVTWSLAEIGAPSTTGTGASGTWGINITGNAATASNATLALRLQATDDRDVKPDTTGIHNVPGVKPFFASKVQIEGAASGTDFGDFLVLDTYSDSSGGKVNGLFFQKSAQGIFHYQGTWNSAAWDAPKRIAYTDEVSAMLPLAGGTMTGAIDFDTNSAKFNNTAVYSPDTTNDVLNFRRYAEDYTLMNIMAPPQAAWGKAKEATLALVRGDNNEYFLDLYNMDYGDTDAGNNMDYGNPKMGLRLQRRGTGVFTPFFIEYSAGGDEARALEIYPRTSTGTINDTLVKVTKDLEVGQTAITKHQSHGYGFFTSTNTANVTTAAPAALLDGLGVALSPTKSYRVTAYNASSSSVRGAVSLFTGDGSAFTHTVVYEQGTSSSHVELYLNSGVPSVRVYNSSSSYDIHYKVDEIAFQSRAFSELAIVNKAPLASPAFTGNPTAPTQSTSDDSTRLATTAFVKAAIAGAAGGTTWNIAGSAATLVEGSSNIVTAAVDMSLPASMSTGSQIIIHAKVSGVRVMSNGNTITGVGSGNNLVLNQGETAILVASASGVVEVV